MNPEQVSWLMRQVRFASFSADYDRLNLKKGNEREEVTRFKRLFHQLQEAISREDYEEAARIRDEMNELKKKI